MKKRYLTFIAVLMSLSFISCSEKEYTCECKGGLTGQYDSEQKIKASSDASASTKCRNLGTPVGTPDGITCSLK